MIEDSDGRSDLWIKSRRTTWAVAALLAGLYLCPLTAHAQSTWRGGTVPSLNPFNWNSADNWTLGVPNAPNAQANFGSNGGGNRGPITLCRQTSK